MRFGGHQSFHLRDQWLSKGIFLADKFPEALVNTATKDAMQKLGMGKNMVDSLRHWLKATNLIKQAPDGFALSCIAKKILKEDPYFELDGTIFLIHYMIATNKKEATTWYWFFNHFYADEFEKDSVENALSAYVKVKTDKKIKDSTLSKDLNCLIRMYQSIAWKGNKNPETENPSPFTKYGWISKKGGKYVRNKLKADNFNIHMFAHIFYMFWTVLDKPESISIEDLMKENSPGRIFNFSFEEINDFIDACSKTKSYLNYSRTGGYFIIHPNEVSLKKALDNYYKEMS